MSIEHVLTISIPLTLTTPLSNRFHLQAGTTQEEIQTHLQQSETSHTLQSRQGQHHWLQTLGMAEDVSLQSTQKIYFEAKYLMQVQIEHIIYIL